MFDTTNIKTSNTTVTNIKMNPACVGTLQKTHIKSKFVRFEIGSEYCKRVFSEIPHFKTYRKPIKYGSVTDYIDEPKEIVVLQAMVFGDKQILMEYVDKEDWEYEDVHE